MSKLQKKENNKIVIKKEDRKGGEWLNQAEFGRATNLSPQTITKYSVEKNPRIEQWVMPSGKKMYWLPDGEKAFSLSAARKLHLARVATQKTQDSETTAMETINPKDLYSIDGFIKLTGLPAKTKPIIYQLIQDKFLPTVKDSDNKPRIQTKSSLAGLRMYREANDASSKAIVKSEEEKGSFDSDHGIGLLLSAKAWAEEADAKYQSFIKYVSDGVFDDCLLKVKITGTDKRQFYSIEWPGKKIAKVIIDIILKRTNNLESCKVLLNRKVNKMLLAQREEANQPEVVEKVIQNVNEITQPVEKIEQGGAEEIMQPAEKVIQEVMEELTQVAGEIAQVPSNGYATEKYVQDVAKGIDDSQGATNERLTNLEVTVIKIGKAVKELVNRQLGF